MLNKIVCHATEVLVIIAFLFACRNALSQTEGRRWLFTVLWGSVTGYFLEALVVNELKLYDYGDKGRFLLFICKTPVFIGLGWGTVFYITTLTAQRLGLRGILRTAFVAGILAVNLDLSLDPTAVMNGLWNWHDVAFSNCFFGVPFDNFVSWLAIIGIYSATTSFLFARLPKPSLVRDVLVPLFGGGLSLVLLAFGVRPAIQALYKWVQGFVHDVPANEHALANSFGQAVVFLFLFIAGMVMCWQNVFRASRDQPVNRTVLGLAVFFHVLSAVLFLTGLAANWATPVTFTPIAVFIPINAIAGCLAFAWPSIDTLFRGKQLNVQSEIAGRIGL